MILNTIFILLSVILLLLLLLLFVPFRYGIRVVNNESDLFYEAKTHWLFGLLQIAYSSQYTFHVKLLGKVIKIKQSGDRDQKKTAEKKDKKKRKRKKRRITLKGIKYILSCLRKIIKKYRPCELTIKGRLGFEDPALTGFAQGFSSYFHGLVDTNHLAFVYDEEVYEGTLYSYGNITLYYLVFIFLKLLFYKPARQLIF